MLNPIEFCFEKTKTFIRNETSIKSEFRYMDATFAVLESVTSEDLEEYYRKIRENCCDALV